MLLTEHRSDRKEQVTRVRPGVVRKTNVAPREILSLRTLQGVPGVMPLIDYGSNWYEMPEYPLCLADRLRLTKQEIWSILRSIYDTIYEINSRGWVHCDVAPWNVWMYPDLRPVLSDFGQCYYNRDSNANPEDCDIYGRWGAKTPRLSFRGILLWIQERYDMEFQDEHPEFVALEAKMREGLPDGLETSYQQMTWPGGYEICGTRDCNARWSVMSAGHKLLDRSVLDLGCNFGWFTFQAAKSGARVAVGLDSIPKYVTCALEMAKLFYVPRALFCVFDIADLSVQSLTESTGLGHYDVVLCLSVWHHIVDKASFMSELRNIAKERIYFEMTREGDAIHNPEANFAHFSQQDWLNYLTTQLPEWTVKFLGMDGVLQRPLFEAIAS